MEINGKIIELLPEKSGDSANGAWRKQEYILETDAQYLKTICSDNARVMPGFPASVVRTGHRRGGQWNDAVYSAATAPGRPRPAGAAPGLNFR